MKNLNVIYKHGHLYDTVTQKRLILKDGATFSLQGDNTNFLFEDELNLPFSDAQIRNSSEVLRSLKSDKDLKSYYLLLPVGSKLSFRIGISKTKTEDENREHYFEVTLLEDLLMYLKIGVKEDIKPSLFECNCVVNKNLYESVEFFENIYASSVNNAFGKTCMMYFANQRSSAANVFNVFEHEGEKLKVMRDSGERNMITV
jgi:hypothetical protein